MSLAAVVVAALLEGDDPFPGGVQLTPHLIELCHHLPPQHPGTEDDAGEHEHDAYGDL